MCEFIWTFSLKDADKFEVELKSDLNSEIQKLIPNVEDRHRQLQQLIDDILDQRVAKTDMKLRHIVSKGIVVIKHLTAFYYLCQKLCLCFFTVCVSLNMIFQKIVNFGWPMKQIWANYFLVWIMSSSVYDINNSIKQFLHLLLNLGERWTYAVQFNELGWL